MFCPKCGQQNPENGTFCIQCGSPLKAAVNQPTQAQPMPNQPVQNQYYPSSPQPNYQKPSGSKTGLVIVLSIAGVVVVGLVIAIILFFSRGVPVTGFWYCEEVGDAVEFKSNGRVIVHMYSEDLNGEYKYNRSSQEGVIVIDDTEFDFVVEKDEMDIMGEQTYIRAEKGFDLDEYLVEANSSQTTTETPAVVTETPAIAIENVSDLSLTLTLDYGVRTGMYTGEMVDGLPNGYGSFSTVNPDGLAWTYEGEWKNGHCNGQGTTSWEDGFTEGGQYQNDYLNGYGWEYWDDVLQYEGEYLDGEFNGQGTLYAYTGEVLYSGAFQNGFIYESAEDRADRVGTVKDQCATYSYQELYDACESGDNIYAKVTGKIFQIYYSPETNPVYCYIYIYNAKASTNDEVTGVYYWLSEGEVPPVEDQTVTVWGPTHDLYSYTAIDDSDWTIPQIQAWSVE